MLVPPTAKRAKIGRPTLKTRALCARICERIASGETLLAICRDKGFPAYPTICRWLFSGDREFRENYARAREAQADYFAEEIIQVAREATPESYNADRVLVDALKWRAARISPKKYGDRPAETHVTTHVGSTVLISPEAIRQLQERRVKLLEEGKPEQS